MKTDIKNRHGMIVSFALIVTMTMVLSSMAAVMADGTRQDDELILRIAMQDDLKTTNPLTAGDVWTWNVIGYLYDGPVNADPETDELIPYIAVGSANLSTTIDYTAGELDWDDCEVGVFDFTPRDTWEKEVFGSDVGEAIIFYDFTGVTWHDGVQMSIKDVMFSFHVNAQVPEWSSSMNCLKENGGRTPSNFSTESWLHIYKVWESDDDMKAALKFVMTEPFADFFRNTVSTFLLPYHIWGSTEAGQNVDGAQIWCDANPKYDLDNDIAWKVGLAQEWDNPTPIGNGPFEWGHWDPGSISKITAWRDHFYKEGFQYDDRELAKQPNIDAMVFKIYKTAEAAVLALKNDDIDYIAWSVPPTFVQELANEPGVALQQSPEQGFFYLSYNMRRQSFGYDEEKSFPYAYEDDKGMPFRKAVAHCINKNRIVQRLLLNFGIAGEGPVSSVSSWFNKTIPRYAFDPDEAINILTAAGYILDNPDAPPGPTNHWSNPDGSQIGEDGLIKILTPEANYDPIRAQAGLMIAQQLQDVGINAKSEAMDFGSIVDRIDERNFDMYILGWRIGSDPTDFLHAFFHSSTAASGQNYPGYQNQSFDDIIDIARATGDEETRKQAVFDAQACIAYDLPYDVLYFRTNIEAYRSDRFTGWIVGSSGSIYNWRSIMNLRSPSPYKLAANFVSPPSAMVSNDTIPVTVLVNDQDREPVEGAFVILNATLGSLATGDNLTLANGKYTTTFTAPYVPPTEDNRNNGTQVVIQIKEVTYTEGDTEYDPAPSRLALITVYPEGEEFLNVYLSADPDVIDPDVNEDGTLGFTYVEVSVKNQDGDPAAGVAVAVEISPAIPDISPAETTTDADGKATFKVTSIDEEENDDSTVEYLVIAKAYDTANPDVKPGENNLKLFIVDKFIDTGGGGGTPFPSFIVITSVFCVAAVTYGVIRKVKK